MSSKSIRDLVEDIHRNVCGNGKARSNGAEAHDEENGNGKRNYRGFPKRLPQPKADAIQVAVEMLERDKPLSMTEFIQLCIECDPDSFPSPRLPGHELDRVRAHILEAVGIKMRWSK